MSDWPFDATNYLFIDGRAIDLCQEGGLWYWRLFSHDHEEHDPMEQGTLTREQAPTIGAALDWVIAYVLKNDRIPPEES